MTTESPERNLYIIYPKNLGLPFFVKYYDELGVLYYINEFAKTPAPERGSWIKLNDNCLYDIYYENGSRYVGSNNRYNGYYGKKTSPWLLGISPKVEDILR